MIRLLTIYLLILFACTLTWYITKQLKDTYDTLKSTGSFHAAKPVFLLLAFLLFALAGIQSFFESPEDTASHMLLVIMTLLLSIALAVNKASINDLIIVLKRYLLKCKMYIAYQLIKFGKRK